jgi:hypothetical protein
VETAKFAKELFQLDDALIDDVEIRYKEDSFPLHQKF